jgi:Domain of unknown function (DUF4432)
MTNAMTGTEGRQPAAQAGPCLASELTLAHSLAAVRIENEALSATVLAGKGADIYELTYKPRGIDVLWKSPWGLKDPAHSAPTSHDSQTAWLSYYPGGWQGIFPNGGAACKYQGVELGFHGEASLVPWDYEIVEPGGDAAEVRFSVRLFHSPFRLERTLRVEAGRPVLTVRERIANEGGMPLDFMWGHHPAFGAPFISGACHIDIGATTFCADDLAAGTYNPAEPGACFPWPMGERNGRQTDMSQVPGPETPRDIMAYFRDFEAGWYGITNRDLGFGVGLVWPKEVFPYAWFWQEMHASAGFPWYRGVYVMAIEPFTSFPGQGLLNVMAKTGTHRTLGPGESVDVEFRAVFYEAHDGIERINPDGKAVVRG